MTIIRLTRSKSRVSAKSFKPSPSLTSNTTRTVHLRSPPGPRPQIYAGKLGLRVQEVDARHQRYHLYYYEGGAGGGALRWIAFCTRARGWWKRKRARSSWRHCTRWSGLFFCGVKADAEKSLLPTLFLRYLLGLLLTFLIFRERDQYLHQPCRGGKWYQSVLEKRCQRYVLINASFSSFVFLTRCVGLMGKKEGRTSDAALDHGHATAQGDLPPVPIRRSLYVLHLVVVLVLVDAYCYCPFFFLILGIWPPTYHQ